jgi:hypothetical protein
LKKKDILWIISFTAIVFILAFPATRSAFLSATKSHPYIMGFIKVSILATMGELLALRILTGDYKNSIGLLYKFIVWGFIGIAFTIVFVIFAAGVGAAVNQHLLPSIKGTSTTSRLIIAFYTSTFMNLIFAPTFMAFHRFTDTFIDLGEGRLNKILKVKLSSVVRTVDWNGFVSFVILKTIPFFWIPAHTITFMLPSEYRVLMASMLSMVLGGMLAFAKRRNVKAV